MNYNTEMSEQGNFGFVSEMIYISHYAPNREIDDAIDHEKNWSA